MREYWHRRGGEREDWIVRKVVERQKEEVRLTEKRERKRADKFVREGQGINWGGGNREGERERRRL